MMLYRLFRFLNIIKPCEVGDEYTFLATRGLLKLYISTTKESHPILVDFLLDRDFKIEKISSILWHREFKHYWLELTESQRLKFKGSVLRIENIDLELLNEYIELRTSMLGYQ